MNKQEDKSQSIRMPAEVYRELQELQDSINRQGYANLPAELLQHISPKRWVTMADVVSMLVRHMREPISEALRVKTQDKTRDKKEGAT